MISKDTQDSYEEGKTCQILQIVFRAEIAACIGVWNKRLVVGLKPQRRNDVEPSLSGNYPELLEVADTTFVEVYKETACTCVVNYIILQKLVKHCLGKLFPWRVDVASS